MGPKTPEVISPLINLAQARLDLNHAQQAEAPIRYALAIIEGSVDSNYPLLHSALSTYAEVLKKTNQQTLPSGSRRIQNITTLLSSEPAKKPGARLHGMGEVNGSTPFRSTKTSICRRECGKLSEENHPFRFLSQRRWCRA